jgi:hypothetical protein
MASAAAPPTQAVELARSLVDQIEREMLDTDPEREPLAMVVLAEEHASAKRLLEQTKRRAEAKLAWPAAAEPRGAAGRQSRAPLWAAWKNVSFLSRRVP